MEKKNRWGIRKITEIVEQKFKDAASDNLSESDIERFNSESGVRGYVAHNYPSDMWEPLVGFAPDRVFYSEVTIGLAVDPPQPPDIYAKILACREKDHEFFHFVWKPDP